MDAIPGGNTANIEAVKRTVYSIGLPTGAAMALLLLYFEHAQGTLHIVDRIGLPLTSALLLILWLGFKLRWGRMVVLESILFSGVSLMVIASLAYSALKVTEHDILNLTGLGYWTPVLYTLAFLIFGVRTGRTIALMLYALLLGVWGSEVFFSQSGDIFERSILFQLFASNALLLLLLYGFGVLVKLQAQQAARYAHDAYTDVLTDLPNRRSLYTRLTRELERAERYQRTFSVILIDLDHFKSVNDSCGHSVGDQVLAEFALLLREQLRKPDSAGRWGGEEFLLLLPELPLAGALEVAERFRQTLEAHPFPHGEPLTASFGVAETVAGERLELLLARADRALYKAKAQGRNLVMPTFTEAPEWVALSAQVS